MRRVSVARKVSQRLFATVPSSRIIAPGGRPNNLPRDLAQCDGPSNAGFLQAPLSGLALKNLAFTAEQESQSPSLPRFFLSPAT